MSNLNTNVGVDVDVVKEVTAEVEVSASEVEQPTAVTNGIPPDGKKGEVLTKNSSAPYDASWKKVSEVVGGGLSEEEVTEIVGNATKDLQPKTDETLDTNSKQVGGAINEVYGGLVKGINSSITEETNELVLELKGKDGTVLFSTKVQLPKGEVPDLTDYVKNTDKASSSSYGVMRTYHNQWSSGLTFIQDMLAVYAAEKSAIDAKVNTTCPIVPFNIDYAWKVSATTNTETWTDDEMQSARDLIGAVGKTQMATESIAGVVWKAERVEIDRFGYNHYIDAYYLPYGVKRCFTNPSTQFPWTEEDKTKALELLGAIPRKRSGDRDVGDGTIPVYNSNGLYAWKRIYGLYLDPFSVPYRDKDAVLHGGMPTTATGLTPKDYVDNLPDKLTLTDEEKAKWRRMTGCYDTHIVGFNYIDDYRGNPMYMDVKVMFKSGLEQTTIDAEAVVNIIKTEGYNSNLQIAIVSQATKFEDINNDLIGVYFDKDVGALRGVLSDGSEETIFFGTVKYYYIAKF